MPTPSLPPNRERLHGVGPGVATDVLTSTQFLYTGRNPIQTGVAPGTIEPQRAAVLRGRVDHARWPAAARRARSRVLEHPELGQTLSRADGMFDLAVNGGGLLIVNYAKPGFLPVQRQVERAAGRTSPRCPTWRMIALDPQVTTIDLGSTPGRCRSPGAAA